jgi:hypothetical protein
MAPARSTGPPPSNLSNLPAEMTAHWYVTVPALIALVGVLITLWVNGARTERQRKRDLHARALAAITAYGEMPYRIRRRPPGAEARARLSDDLSLIKAEVDTCQVLLAADGDEQLSDAYDALYGTARKTVGKEAHDAWGAPVIDDDSAMNQGDLYRRLEPFNIGRNAFIDSLRNATLPRWRRLSQWTRTKWPRLGRLPGVRVPTPSEQRRIVAPQDLPEAPE